MDEGDFNPIRRKIAELRVEHRDLDDAIHRLTRDDVLEGNRDLIAAAAAML